MLKIVVLHRGWVLIGNRSQLKDRRWLIENAHVIRRWGTVNGLGELGLNGPTDKTILDPIGRIDYNEQQELFVTDVDQSKWTKYYGD